MVQPEWKPGFACKGKHLLIDFYRETNKSSPRVIGTRCAPIQHQAGMSSVMIECDNKKCPMLAEQDNDILTKQTNFVFKHANKRNRDLTTLQVSHNQFPTFRAYGVVEIQGTVTTAHYTLPEHLRKKIPKKGINYHVR